MLVGQMLPRCRNRCQPVASEIVVHYRAQFSPLQSPRMQGALTKEKKNKLSTSNSAQGAKMTLNGRATVMPLARVRPYGIVKVLWEMLLCTRRGCDNGEITSLDSYDRTIGCTKKRGKRLINNRLPQPRSERRIVLSYDLFS